MRQLLIVTCFILGTATMQGQNIPDTLGGEVTFITSQSVYVKFPSAKGISSGDTLFIWQDGKMEPALLVTFTSSTSCVGTSLSGHVFGKGDRIFSRVKAPRVPPESIKEEPQIQIPDLIVTPETEEEAAPVKEESKKQTQTTDKIKGRLTAASYINFSDRHESDRQRMRYTLSFNSNRIGNTGLSVETYISFRHTINEWQEVKDNFHRTFKIYNLALQYDIGNGTRFWVGRKINPSIANIGAIDGFQAEKKWKAFTIGAIAGSRPDHTDYDFNFNLLQFGVYAGHQKNTENGIIQSTLAFAEQRNGNMTDRRYAYFQHINSAIRHVNIFTSFEFDLYALENDKPKSTFTISSIYVSARYKVSNKLSVFGSYDARKNIIYYETYKNFIDQLLEDETRQGLRFSFNFKPWKKITIGSSAGYRFQKGSTDASKNLNSYLTISRIPKLQASATFSFVLIQSPYLEGMIYGVRMSRDLVKGKLFGEAEYRIVKYQYTNIETPLKQSIAGGHLTWRFSKKLSFALNYEGEIQNKQVNNRIYTNITQRF